MIHGTWRKVRGYWQVRIPKDAWWRGRAPLPMDTVLVQSKDGTVKEVIIAEVESEDERGWTCPVYDESYVGCEADGFDPWDYPDEGDLGGFWDMPGALT